MCKTLRANSIHIGYVRVWKRIVPKIIGNYIILSLTISTTTFENGQTPLTLTLTLKSNLYCNVLAVPANEPTTINESNVIRSR